MEIKKQYIFRSTMKCLIITNEEDLHLPYESVASADVSLCGGAVVHSVPWMPWARQSRRTDNSSVEC